MNEKDHGKDSWLMRKATSNGEVYIKIFNFNDSNRGSGNWWGNWNGIWIKDLEDQS